MTDHKPQQPALSDEHAFGDSSPASSYIGGDKSIVNFCRDFYENLLRDRDERIKALQAFKDYVHQRLDEAGIEKDPPGPHADAGCRVGQRLDIALAGFPNTPKTDE